MAKIDLPKAGSLNIAVRRSPSRWSTWRKTNHEFFLRKLGPLPRSLDLVDIGAGAVEFANIFKQFQYTGVDFEPFEDIDIVADLTKGFPIEDASYSIVTLSNTLEHLPDFELTLRECFRVLKPGGYIASCTPFIFGGHQEPYDFNRPTYFQHVRTLELAGFVDIEVEPLGKLIDMPRNMMMELLDSFTTSKQPFWGRVFRKVFVNEFKIVERIYGQIPATRQYTQGFGCFARKPLT